ncbi:MAG: sugar phosphate nucleotidyltransferase, partial [Alphaproteobacteria bacterium]
SVEKILPKDARIYYTRQGEPKGLGHAIWCAAGITRDEPFAVLLPDDVMCTDVENSLSKMIEIYNETGKSVVLCEEVPRERTQNYGILDLVGGVANRRAAAKGFVEKPKPEDAPSNLSVIGRYVLTADHMEHLARGVVGKGGEIQLTDAMHQVAAKDGFYGYVSTSKRFDCGDKVGFQMANLYFALQDPYIAPLLKPYILETAAGLKGK